MNKKILSTGISAALLLVGNIAIANTHTDQKYGGACAYSLAAKGEEMKTDCKVSWTDPKDKSVYCFGNEEAKKEFAKDVEKHKQMADQAYSKLHAGGHEAGAAHEGHSMMKDSATSMTDENTGKIKGASESMGMTTGGRGNTAATGKNAGTGKPAEAKPSFDDSQR